MTEGNCIGDFLTDDVLDTNDADKSITTLLNVIKVVTLADVFVSGSTLIGLEVSVSERDGSQGLACVVGDNVEEVLLNTVVKGDLLSVFVKIGST